MKQIPLNNRKNEPIFALVDDCDYEELSQYNWHKTKAGYASRYAGGGRKNRMCIYMHRQIMNPPQGMVVDHKNRDTLDNTRDNLRITDQSRNMQNARPRTRSTSIYKGVYWNNEKRLWSAYIHVDGKRIYLGRHVTQKDAAITYNEAAKKHFGEFALLNEINPNLDDRPVAERKPPKKTKYIGVVWDKNRSLWMARFTLNGKVTSIGRFADETEAARARDKVAFEKLGYSAKLTFPHHDHPTTR